MQFEAANSLTFVVGILGVQFLLSIGAGCAAALGYNYRCITLQLARIEAMEEIDSVMLGRWPRDSWSFYSRYARYRTPPEAIGGFWNAFKWLIVPVTVLAGAAIEFGIETLTICVAGLLPFIYSLTKPYVCAWKFAWLADPNAERFGWPDLTSHARMISVPNRPKAGIFRFVYRSLWPEWVATTEYLEGEES